MVAHRDRRTAKSVIRVTFLFSLTLLAVAACGKVGDPLPPFLRVPESAVDFTVEQVGYELRFRWTNPSRNLDQSLSTDLARAFIQAGDEVIADLEVEGPGVQEAFRLPSRNLVGVDREYSVFFGTDRGRFSEPSRPVRFSVVPIPGAGPVPASAVDQSRVRLDWAPPAENGDLVDGYRVYRSGELLTRELLPDLFFDDLTFVEGATYAYVVAGVRTIEGRLIQGEPYPALDVVAADRTPPAAPENVRIVPYNTGAFIRWRQNTETDIARYRVYRRSRDDSPLVPIDDGGQIITFYDDGEYRPGFAYSVSAVDESGNEGPVSEAVLEP